MGLEGDVETSQVYIEQFSAKCFHDLQQLVVIVVPAEEMLLAKYLA